MKVALFYHSLYSDWNFGIAHFLRGIVRELQKKGHNVNIYEPSNGLSMRKLLSHQGKGPLEEFHHYYPGLFSKFYDLSEMESSKELEDMDLVIVHECNHPKLIANLGKIKEKMGYRLLFHDTHHLQTTRHLIYNFDLSHYDGILASGQVIKNIYLEKGWSKNLWVWHEAADTHIFKPPQQNYLQGDLVWIGNWGDDERTDELHEYLIKPVQELKLKAKVYGVRYPLTAIEALTQAGIEYGGWIPNYKVPDVFARYRVTIHVPRRPYVEQLPGIPTIRPFEALACGIPLVCAPWQDVEGLFTENHDYLMAHDKDQMKQKLSLVLNDPDLSQKLAANGLKTILQQHTCRHRVDQLESICREMGLNPQAMKLQQT